jgi:3-oxoacyl-[acyl-carrier protein] reductase
VAEAGGPVALVTGVGRAGQIGHAVAHALGADGARLVIVDVNAAAVAERAAELRARGVPVEPSSGDLTTPAAARAAVDVARRAFGGLDVVVNVAGGLFSYGPFLDQTPERLDLELAVNLKTTVNVCQAAIPALLERGGGAIVNFASIAALHGGSHLALYAAAKSAVAGLTRALAREFKDRGIRVNAVAPITVRTKDNLAQLGAAGGAPMVDVADVVSVVRFLASDDARAVTGQLLPITGRGD